MRIIVSAGGTGGHIYPALAIIEKLKEQVDDLDVLYIGTRDRMEAEIVPKRGIKYLGVELKGLNRRNPLANFKVLSKYLKAKQILKKEISAFKPDLVLGIGGYITLPVCTIAKKLGYKVFIHEQNSIPGLSNKIIAKKADLIGVSLEDSIKYFPKEKTVFTGNPCSEQILKVKELSYKELGLKDMPTIMIVMGSMGSKTVSKSMIEILPKFANQNYQVIFISGKNYFEEFSKMNLPENVTVYPYLDNMGSYLKKTDLIISRAGATTISEITVLGLPSILIPSPYVTHNHQEENAKVLEEAGASIVIKEKDLSAQKLLESIDFVLKSKTKYDIMSESNKKIGIRDSASKIAKLLIDLAGEK